MSEEDSAETAYREHQGARPADEQMRWIGVSVLTLRETLTMVEANIVDGAEPHMWDTLTNQLHDLFRRLDDLGHAILEIEP